MHQLVTFGPGGISHHQVGREGLSCGFGQRIGVVEIINQLFHRHRILGWQVPLVEHAPHKTVAGSGHIDREGANGIIRCGDYRALFEIAKAIAIRFRCWWRNCVTECWRWRSHTNDLRCRLGNHSQGHFFLGRTTRQIIAGNFFACACFAGNSLQRLSHACIRHSTYIFGLHFC